MMESVVSIFDNLRNYLFSAHFIYSPIYLLATILMARLIWRARRVEGSFLRFIIPRAVYCHPSSLVDLKLTSLNVVLAATGMTLVFAFAPLVTHEILALLNGLVGTSVSTDLTLVRGLFVALLLFLTQDFCRFLIHYWHHKNGVLWPFHAVHHSAQVLSPITFLRGHPVYYVLQQLLFSVVIGVVQALVLFIFVRQIELWVLYAGTLAFQLYIFLGAHFRHSHIRLSYGRVVEHILISPAQHQIHHSSCPKHFDKNFGEIFAFWDWMFGTLYIADKDEELVFGLADKDGRLIAQPHATLRAALLHPFAESGRALRQSMGRGQYGEGRQDTGPETKA